MNHADAEVTIGDGKTEVKTTLGGLAKAADQIMHTAPVVDVFAWANNLVSDREEYDIQLFLISKNSVLYSLNSDQYLKDRLRVLFLDGVLDDVFSAAETGHNVLPYEETLKGDGNIAWLAANKAHRVKDALIWVEEHAADIERFDHDEHDIRRMKGIVAKFTKPGAKTFYSFKQFGGKQAVINAAGNSDFAIRKDKVMSFIDYNAAFKIDDSSQVVAVENDVFVFNQSKFEQLFDTKPHMVAVANRNGSIIDQRFGLSMPLLVQEIAILAQGNNSALKKLSEIDPEAMDQEQVLDAIEEYGIPLMLDDAGKIILMDSKDVVRFLDVLSDNYLHGINGNYLAKNKKPFEGEQNEL